ncbi:TPA: ead/Ea22-like family protein [Klebsiella pneumoniae]
MTDITELAQSLKAAAEKATPGPWYVHDKPCEDGNYGIDTSDKEFLAEAVVWWGFARQSIWREEDAKYIALANPANILALVEALEKAQAQSSKWLEAYHKAVSIGARYEERIAELESRTVTVKLPPHAPENLACCLDGYETWLIATTFRDTWNKCLDEVMRTGGAGIKWEAE